MNIFIMLFMVINFFTYAAYSMKKDDLAYQEINPIDAELLRRVVKEEISIGNINIINLAKDIIANHIENLKNVIDQLSNNDNIAFDKINFIHSYITKFNEDAINTLNDSKNIEKNYKISTTLKPLIENINILLQSEIIAWNIVHNSLHDNLNHEQLLMLLPEIVKIYTYDSFHYSDKKGDLWFDNVATASKILSLLLVMIATEDHRGDKEKILVFLHDNLGKPNWFWCKFLKLIDSKDVESPLWLSDKDKAFFRYDEINTITIPKDLNLTETKLFMVLAPETSKQLVKDSSLLINYSIFDGDILKYIEKQRQDVLKTLLAEDKTKPIKKHIPKKDPKKNLNYPKKDLNYKKGYQQKIPAKKTKNKAMITNHNTITSYNMAPATISNIINEDNKDNDFIPIKQLKISREKKHDGGYSIVQRHIDNNKLRDELNVHDYPNLVSLAKTRKLHQYEYEPHENILSINKKISQYGYDDQYYDIEKHFYTLNKKIQKCALIKPKHNIASNKDNEKNFIKPEHNIDDEDNNERRSIKQNLFTYFITFHLIDRNDDNDDNGKKFTETYYGDIYSSSKSKSNTWIINQNMLSEAEKDNYYQTCNVFKHLYLCDVVANNCKKAIDGYWLRNARHTEPIFVVDFSERKLAKFIKDIYTKHPNSISTIDAVVMGVVSEYDICGRCQSLLQGLQWNLPHILRSSLRQIKRRDMTELIKINPELITMIIASTEKEIENTRILAKEPKEFNQQDLMLDDGENHRLFLYKK